MHRYRDEPRQDRFSVVYDEESGRILTAVCDGVGSLGMSHRAAAFVAGRMPAAYLQQGGWSKALAEVNRELAALADEVAKSAPDGTDPDACGMRTTFVGAAVSVGAESHAVSIAWTDDSSAWLLDDGEWKQLTGLEAAKDDAIHSTSVRALPHEDPSYRTMELSVERGALFLMTDGVGAPLQSAAEVREVLSKWWSSPPDPFTFARQVGFGRRSHLDDRTVVGIWFGQDSARHPSMNRSASVPRSTVTVAAGGHRLAAGET
jgi:serine/threonine protein phosphatase PrpC